MPENVRDLADKNFSLLKTDPRHPSLRFKKVGIFWSARVGLRYRALAKERAEGLVWFLGARAFSNVVFRAREGTMHALMGENSAGKSR